MKSMLFMLMFLLAQGSILFTEDLNVTTVLHDVTITVAMEVPDDFSSYEVIVISTPSTTFEEETMQHLLSFLESGGGIMLLAEENNLDGTTLVMNQIAQEFSIVFHSDRIYDDQHFYQHTSWISLKDFPDHPVFQGIATLVYPSGCSFQQSLDRGPSEDSEESQASELAMSVQGLVSTSLHAYSEKYDGLVIHERGSQPACMGFFSVGEGRLFVCGDQDLFDSQLDLADNTLFALNVFDWLAGHTEAIAERFQYKSAAQTSISDAQSLLQSALSHGLEEIAPTTIEQAKALLEEAEQLFSAYRFVDSHGKAEEALRLLEQGERDAQATVDATISSAVTCVSRIEEGARDYLPSQLEAAQYYLQEIEEQSTYTQKIDRATQVLELCEEIRIGLQGAAEREIDEAATTLGTYKGIFGRKDHHSARIYLEYAEESYQKGDYGDAIVFAQQSQIYSEKVDQEQKKDYILLAGIIILCVVLVFIYVRK
jgi:ActR/RegA family two-component response regulator